MGDGLVAVGAWAAGAEAAAVEVAVGAAASVEEALFACGAFVDDDGSDGFGWWRRFGLPVTVRGLSAC